LAKVLEELDGEILEQRVGGTGQDKPSGGDTRSGSGAGDGDLAANAPNPVAPDQPPVARIPKPLPPDSPDARDDDVVARQLREAAMAETDPELRESLWEEYRRYKASL